MSYLDTFQLTSSPGGFTTDRAYGFNPGVLISVGSRQSSLTDSASSALDGQVSFGVTDAVTDQCHAIKSDDGATSGGAFGNASQPFAGIAAVTRSNFPGAPIREAGWGITFIAGGARWTTTSTSGAGSIQRQHTLAIPAVRVANSAVGLLTAPAGAGTVVTNVGFAADIVLFFYADALQAISHMGIGVASRAGAIGNVGSFFRASPQGGALPILTQSYSRAGDSLMGQVASGCGTVTAWSSTGFTASWAAGNSEIFGYLALKAAPGYAFEIIKGVTGTTTDPGTIALRSLKPDSGLIVSCGLPEHAAGASTAPGQLSVGLFAPAGTSTQVAVSVLSRDGVTTTETGLAVDYDSIYLNLTNPPNTTLTGEMKVLGLGIRHIDLVMANPDPAPAFFWGLLSGLSVGPGGGGPIFF